VGIGKKARKSRKIGDVTVCKEEDGEGATAAAGTHLICCNVYMIPNQHAIIFLMLHPANTKPTRGTTLSHKSETEGGF
jgi:hypothetical protein